jgi:hypothetical protein
LCTPGRTPPPQARLGLLQATAASAGAPTEVVEVGLLVPPEQWEEEPALRRAHHLRREGGGGRETPKKKRRRRKGRGAGSGGSGGSSAGDEASGGEGSSGDDDDGYTEEGMRAGRKRGRTGGSTSVSVPGRAECGGAARGGAPTGLTARGAIFRLRGAARGEA